MADLCLSSLQKELYNKALEQASGAVRTSFSVVSPKSAVYQVGDHFPCRKEVTTLQQCKDLLRCLQYNDQSLNLQRRFAKAKKNSKQMGCSLQPSASSDLHLSDVMC